MKKRRNLIANKTIVSNKIKEAFSSIFPITLIVLVLAVSVVPLGSGMLLAFILGAFFTVVGIGLFTLGADVAMTPIGEYVGTSTVKTKKIWIIVPIFFLVGLCITIAEPDLQVLAGQLSNTISSWTLLIAVGVGVGIFLVVAFLRILLKIKLKWILLALYLAVFVMAFFVPSAFVPLAFDSGGVTTGPMSVPFIIAIGTGIASMRSDGSADEDSFGLTALCSIGPILAVMILGLIFKPQTIIPPENTLPSVGTSKDLASLYLSNMPHYLKEVAIGLLPTVAFFFIFRIFSTKIDKHSMIKILIGIVYTYVGLVLFLLGVNVGFLPVGTYIGQTIGALSYNWIIVPIGFVIGFFVVAAEPAVHILTKQVYEITSGGVPKRALSVSLMMGVGVSVALAMLRILLKINILYFLIPTYAVAIILTFIVPEIFTGIAFDSGGVASGAMTASFVLPLALGLTTAVGGNIATDGFGVVAFVAMTPLVAIQVLGLVYKIKQAKIRKHAKLNEQVDAQESKDVIID